MNIKQIKISKHCFGETILIDGVPIEEVNKDQLLEWLMAKIREMDDYSFLETFKTTAWSVCEDIEDVDSYRCDQCGDWNSVDILKFE